MKVLVLTNNTVSMPLIKWLGDREEVIVLEEIITTSDLQTIRPDLIVSYGYCDVLDKNVIDGAPGKIINLHISLLPYNRGADLNAWSFLDGTPTGVTIHMIDAGTDAGPTLLQKSVAFDEARDTTLASTYRVLHSELQSLFMENWAALRNGQIEPVRQSSGGSYHRSAELVALKDRLMADQGWNVPIRLFRDRYRQLRGQTS